MIFNRRNKQMNFTQTFPILFASKWNATRLESIITKVDRHKLSTEYRSLVRCAPRRGDSDKQYFVGGHKGVTSSKEYSNRVEEHCAVALFNLNKKWSCENVGQFHLLDYQVPLKAQQRDIGVGKIDLLGVTDQGRLMVIELKVKPKKGWGDAPPAALMEGLRYAAIVQANHDVIANEANVRFRVKVCNQPPIVLLLASQEWWCGWEDASLQNGTGDWQSAFSKLAQEVTAYIGVEIECAELHGGKLSMGLNGEKPTFDPAPTLVCRPQL